MDVLFTFTGFHDPFHKGLVEQEERPGPILSLLTARKFDRVYLFDTPATREITLHTRQMIAERESGIVVEIIDCNISDPTDYSQILRVLKAALQRIQDDLQASQFYISVASGTPQMHACWLLLAASGVIPATVLQVRPPRYVTNEKPLVTEINFAAEGFPLVRARIELDTQLSNEPIDIRDVVAQVGIVGNHPELIRSISAVAMLAPSNTPLLVEGETGTGKELFARLAHRLSGRGANPFIVVNCAALPDSLAESILFGHKRGAFTGATTNQIGKFDDADIGSLFLDEVGELPLPAQAKLLRVLQDGMVEPLGSRTSHKVDVRVIAATNRDLHKMVNQNLFREDLFFRLNVGQVTLPPLRKRRSDIPILALHILDRINASLRRPKQLSVAALNRLQAYNWPGNVRDLQNVLERSARLCLTDTINADDILIQVRAAKRDLFDALPDPAEGFSLEEYLKSTRKQLVLRALDATDGNQSAAARLLGISPQAVHNFLVDLKNGE